MAFKHAYNLYTITQLRKNFTIDHFDSSCSGIRKHLLLNEMIRDQNWKVQHRKTNRWDSMNCGQYGATNRQAFRSEELLGHLKQICINHTVSCSKYLKLPVIKLQTYDKVHEKMNYRSSEHCSNLLQPCEHHFSTSAAEGENTDDIQGKIWNKCD